MMSDEQAEGLVFNIQKFSVNDGEGIRDAAAGAAILNPRGSAPSTPSTRSAVLRPRNAVTA